MTDSSAGGSRFDPRFNPAFQPGYDPAVHARPPSNPARPPVPERASGFVEPFVEVDDGRVRPAEAVLEPEASDLPEDVPASRRIDPYLIGLWVLSAVFVGLGIVVIRVIADTINRLNTTGGGVSFDYNLVLVYTIGAPLLIFLGLATATGTLFLLAARRR